MHQIQNLGFIAFIGHRSRCQELVLKFEWQHQHWQLVVGFEHCQSCWQDANSNQSWFQIFEAFHPIRRQHKYIDLTDCLWRAFEQSHGILSLWTNEAARLQTFHFNKFSIDLYRHFLQNLLHRSLMLSQHQIASFGAATMVEHFQSQSQRLYFGFHQTMNSITNRQKVM